MFKCLKHAKVGEEERKWYGWEPQLHGAGRRERLRGNLEARVSAATPPRAHPSWELPQTCPSYPSLWDAPQKQPTHSVSQADTQSQTQIPNGI